MGLVEIEHAMARLDAVYRPVAAPTVHKRDRRVGVPCPFARPNTTGGRIQPVSYN
jgi:hypothetical protein